MRTLSPPEARGKVEPTSSSTGTDPAGWRHWWAAESERVGTDWKSLMAAADAALSRLRAIHGPSS
jgi:hypothetical protein